MVPQRLRASFLPRLAYVASTLVFLICIRIAHAGLDANSTVFVIVMENHNWSSIVGNPDAPYINGTLLPTASYADQYYNPNGLHPSEPNYIWLEAGSNLGITNDGPPSANTQSTTNHFVTLLKNAGISWKTYQENITGTTCPTTDSYPYAVKHNPFTYFSDVTNCTTVMRPFSELATDLTNNTVARYNFITPNLIDDMHDSAAPLNNPVKQGDTWLAQNLPTILNSTAYQNGGLVVITWDEGEGGADGPIGLIVLSPFAKGGGYHNSIRYTHSSTLRTMQKIFGTVPFLADAANGTDLGNLFIAGGIPNPDLPPTVTTTSAANVAGGNATLKGTVNANGDPTSIWFEYGLTPSYGSTTLTAAADNAESYNTTTYGYGSAGGTGLGVAEYLEGTGGGIYLEAGGRKIDGNKSFAIFAGGNSGNTQAMARSIANAQPAGTLTLSARFDVTNAGSFTGFNLKTAKGTTFGGATELISVGLRPINGNTTIAVNGGAQTINLGSDLRGQIIDFSLSYNCTAGTYLLGAKLRASSNYTTVSGPLRLTGQTATYFGLGNFNTGANQNVIVDSITLATSGAAGNGATNVSVSSNVTGLNANTTYHYRVVAQNARGISYGSDQTFGFALVPDATAPFHAVTSPSGNFAARIYDDSGHLAILGPDLTGAPFASVISLAPPSARIGGELFDFGKVLSVTNLANGFQLTQALAGTTITTQLTFPSEGVMSYEVVNWNGLAPTETNVSAASDANEHFFGFGEKFNVMDQIGKKVHMLTYDQPGAKGDASYKPVPWFISSRGYGFHLDSTAESWFDMRNGATDRYVVQNLFGALKFRVVAGPKLTDVLSRYTGYKGRPALPPPWAFGLWISSDAWRTGGEVRYAVTKFRQNGIPASVFVFDSPWETAYNDFTWNLTQFAAGGTYEGTNYNGFSSIGEMMQFFQANGLKVICWMTPFINTSSNNEGVAGQNLGQASNYSTAATNNYFVRSSPGGSPLVVPWWKGSGSPVDFTNAAATSWLTGQLQSLVSQSNVVTQAGPTEPAIGGFKTDDGETTNGSNTYIPTTAIYSDGRTGVEMRNGYCIEYHKAISSVLGSNGLLFARSGFAGTQQYPGCWAGDNEPNFSDTNGLQSVMVAGNSAAMSGFSIWGHDIGGYQNTNFESNPADLFMRWTQFGALSPLMQLHRQVDANNLRQYPWGYGANALANFVSYARLHTQLFPYLYTYATESSQDGLPIIRPLVLTNQSDVTTYSVKHTYLFGNELLVAPMNALNATSRNVYLPAGGWYDYWTNAHYPGAQTISWSNADPAKMPLFVRDGAIVPMLLNIPQTLCNANYVNNPALPTPDGDLQVLIYPSGNSTFSLYDGSFFQCAVNGSVTTASVTSTARIVVLKLFGPEPAGVERDGVRLEKLATSTDFDAAFTGWRYDASGQFIFVKFHAEGALTKIMFGPDSVGDGITDSWRLRYFGATGASSDSAATADPDGDGVSNFSEFIAGTDPTNAASKFAIEQIANGTGTSVSISWRSQRGIHYQPQWRNSMADSDPWQTNLPTITGDGSLLSWTDDGSLTGTAPRDPLNKQRFYRLVIP